MLKAKKVWALGAMSGTSMDGVDAAMLRTDGHQILEFGQTGYRAYSPEEQTVLSGAMGKWPGEPGVGEAAKLVETAHADLLASFKGAEIVGFHGQTLAHDPRGHGTHQVGDGRVLADALNLPVVYDFRSADVHMGGEGAPLAPFYHHACARYLKLGGDVAFLNLGGVGNLTWVDGRISKPEDPDALLAFDTGPANAPINDLLNIRLGKWFDRDGELAAQGIANEAIVAGFLAHPYFYKIPPKSLDRNTFSDLPDRVAELNNADAAATLTAIAAASAALGVQHCPTTPEVVLVTGGGRRNPVLMSELNARLECPVIPVEDVGLDGDMIEAQAFAYLAVRVAKGLPTSAPRTTGVRAAVGGGLMCQPHDLNARRSG